MEYFYRAVIPGTKRVTESSYEKRSRLEFFRVGQFFFLEKYGMM